MSAGNPSITDLKLVTLSISSTSTLFSLRKPGHLAIALATAVVFLFKVSSATDPFTIVTSVDVGILVSLGGCLFVLILTQSPFDVFTRNCSFGEAYSDEVIWSLIFRPKFVFIPKILWIIAYLSCLICDFWELTAYIPSIRLSGW
jgi:hypothetical protein